jgi:hypothetical protein
MVTFQNIVSMVYHSDFTDGIIAEVPSHPFAGLPIRQAPVLLDYLKRYITTNPSRKMKATGVPHHVRQLELLRGLTEHAQSTLKVVSNLVPHIQLGITDAIENAAIRGGHVTPNFLENLMSQVTEKIKGWSGPKIPRLCITRWATTTRTGPSNSSD